jgi:crotonobetainyl-CoA:carnitine CoA-transferase CaiB-like acyl-CoA transferase
MSGALSHLRVLDLSRILAGPWCGQLLADLGAEVIKVERPESGDDTRGWGPPFLQDAEGRNSGDAAYFLCANRNKKSVTIDFTRPEGQELVRELAAKSDVVIENFKVGGLKAYGLDYTSLKAVNPGLIYCSITGFGQDGPYATRPGYDFLIQAMGGLMSITGHKEGEPGAGPQKVGVALTDILTGLYSGVGILAALAHRERTGIGQHIDMALMDVQVACLANQAMNYLVGGKAPVALGNSHPNIVPYQDFPTADGHMIIAVGNDAQFTRLCAVLGEPSLGADARYASNRSRVENRAELVPALGKLTRARATREWVSLLETAGVPCGPINDLAAVFEDPQVLARGLKIELPHPLAGTAPGVANPIRMSETPVSYRSAAPCLGADTVSVLTQILGMAPYRAASLAKLGIV